jgi:hypothetical protein
LHDISAIASSFSEQSAHQGPRRLPPSQSLNVLHQAIVDALTGVMFAALARVRPIGPLRVEIPAGDLTAANCAIFGRKQGSRNVTPFLARTLSWAEVADGTSIVFDLRITALDGEAEAETRGRFVAEAIRVVGAFLLEQGVRFPPT